MSARSRASTRLISSVCAAVSSSTASRTACRASETSRPWSSPARRVPAGARSRGRRRAATAPDEATARIQMATPCRVERGAQRRSATRADREQRRSPAASSRSAAFGRRAAASSRVDRLGRAVRELQVPVDRARPTAGAGGRRARGVAARARAASPRPPRGSPRRGSCPSAPRTPSTTGKAPQASANPRSVWTRPPKSARLYAGTSDDADRDEREDPERPLERDDDADRGRGRDRHDRQADEHARGIWMSRAVVRRARRAHARRRPCARANASDREGERPPVHGRREAPADDDVREMPGGVREVEERDVLAPAARAERVERGARGGATVASAHCAGPRRRARRRGSAVARR